jgi:hypothetical protein
MGLAGQSGGLAPMLKTLFSFLHRKTDFYIEHPEQDKEAKMGFAPGMAEQLVRRHPYILMACFGLTCSAPVQLLSAFRSYPYKDMNNMVIKRSQPKQTVAPKQKAAPKQAVKPGALPSPTPGPAAQTASAKAAAVPPEAPTKTATTGNASSTAAAPKAAKQAGSTGGGNKLDPEVHPLGPGSKIQYNETGQQSTFSRLCPAAVQLVITAPSLSCLQFPSEMVA